MIMIFYFIFLLFYFILFYFIFVWIMLPKSIGNNFFFFAIHEKSLNSKP